MDERISNLLEEVSKKLDFILDFITKTRFREKGDCTGQLNRDGSSPNLSTTSSSSSIVSFDCSD